MSRLHKLDLYRLAVQHPMAEISFLLRAYGWASDCGKPATPRNSSDGVEGAEVLSEKLSGTPGGSEISGGGGVFSGVPEPMVFREDFAGSSVNAMAWLMMDPSRQAVAVERHGPTLRWAQRLARKELGHAADRLMFVEADVLAVHVPRADVVASLNFSVFSYHDRGALLRYFKHARSTLRPGGVWVMDAYGGPGAMRTSLQKRIIEPPKDTLISPFEYQWEQRAFCALTHRADCRIHFVMSDGTIRKNAFRYDWRLWTLPELVELLKEAGFAHVAVWCDHYDPKAGMSDGFYQPVTGLPAREDWVAYLTATG